MNTIINPTIRTSALRSLTDSTDLNVFMGNICVKVSGRNSGSGHADLQFIDLDDSNFLIINDKHSLMINQLISIPEFVIRSILRNVPQVIVDEFLKRLKKEKEWKESRKQAEEAFSDDLINDLDLPS